MSVTLRHPLTGDIKVMPEGWSWACCIGCGFLGLPLFRRGLQVWGSAMVALNTVALIVGFIAGAAAATLYFWLFVAWLGACVFFGMKANQMAIERWVDHGWEIVAPARKWS